jgi:phage gp36-like protein
VPQTPDSTATSYADGDDMIVRYDVRVLGDLLSDSGTRVAAASVAAHATLEELLLDASGEVESACCAGGRYGSADLAALSGAGLRFLKRLVCGSAMFALLHRRKPDMVRADWDKGIDETLERLRKGERIFSTDEAQAAGQMERLGEDDLTADVRPGLSDYAGRFFGSRYKDQPY